MICCVSVPSRVNAWSTRQVVIRKACCIPSALSRTTFTIWAAAIWCWASRRVKVSHCFRRWVSILDGSTRCRASCCVWANPPYSRITIRSRASTTSVAGRSSCCGRPAARRAPTRQGSIWHVAGRSGLTTFVGTAARSARQEPTNANCCPCPPPCRSMTDTTRQLRWMIFRRG